MPTAAGVGPHRGHRPTGVVRGLALVGVLGLASYVHADPYRLGEGDIIDVIVAGELELSSGPQGILVGPDGTIGVPMVGTVQVVGKTCDEVAELIRENLAGRIVVDPQVLVRVQKYNQGVSVLGFVVKAGLVPIRTGQATLSEVLSAAGGVAEGLGDPHRVVVNRKNGEVLEVDAKAVATGTAGAPVLVSPGDVVYVPHTANEVNVFGYVRLPSRYPFYEGDRVSDLLARSGGPLVGRMSGTAEGDLTKVTLMRADGSSHTLDLTTALADEERDGNNPPVQAGDAVFVPEVHMDVSVLGHVNAPGRIKVQPGDRVSDALAAAGGPITPTRIPADSTAADLSNSLLYRASGEVIALNLQLLYEKPDQFQDLPLEPGDVIIIPEGQNRAEVAGYVRTPGYVEFRPGDTVRTMIAMAGGVLPGAGTEKAVEVRHADGTEETVDLENADPPVRPGDSIRVPFARERVAVVGFVEKPGLYEWHEGDTVVDMIANAAGPRGPGIGEPFKIERGHLTKAVLVRREADEDKAYHIDLQRFYRQGDRSANPPVLPGDVIVVPRKGKFDFEALTRDLLFLPRLFN